MSAELAELPPSAKLCYKVLEYEQPLTQKEIVERTRLSRRTTRFGLARLENVGVVEKETLMLDARQKRYSLAD